MVSKVPSQKIDFSSLQNSLDELSRNAGSNSSATQKSGKSGFLELLENGIKEVNKSAHIADKASMELASGKNGNIHETMLAVTQAELGFNMMVQMRNKIIDAYQEVMRMQI